MAPKVKALFKGFKYISQIFVYKEQEMEIGHPTDVRHVSHVGFEGGSANAPSWMSQFKSASDVTPASLNGFSWPSPNGFVQSRETSWSSQDFEQTRRCQSDSSSGNYTDKSRPEIPKPTKKKKRKKAKASSPVMSRSSSRTSFASAFEGPDETPNRLPIAYGEHGAEMQNQLQPTINEPLCV